MTEENNTDDNQKIDNNDTSAIIYKWSKEDDLILKEWADKSACFKWLHEKSYKIYKKQSI